MKRWSNDFVERALGLESGVPGPIGSLCFTLTVFGLQSWMKESCPPYGARGCKQRTLMVNAGKHCVKDSMGQFLLTPQAGQDTNEGQVITWSITPSAEYVFMGGQLFAPQTRAKWINGSCFSNATLSLGSELPKGRVNANFFLLARRTPFSISCRE